MMRPFAFLRVHFQSGRIDFLTQTFWDEEEFLTKVDWWNCQAERMDMQPQPRLHSWLYVPLPGLRVISANNPTYTPLPEPPAPEVHMAYVGCRQTACEKERTSGIEVTFYRNRVTCKDCRAEARK